MCFEKVLSEQKKIVSVVVLGSLSTFFAFTPFYCIITFSIKIEACKYTTT